MPVVGAASLASPSARVLPGDLIRTVSARLWRFERWAVGPGGGRRFWPAPVWFPRIPRSVRPWRRLRMR